MNRAKLFSRGWELRVRAASHLGLVAAVLLGVIAIDGVTRQLLSPAQARVGALCALISVACSAVAQLLLGSVVIDAARQNSSIDVDKPSGVFLYMRVAEWAQWSCTAATAGIVALGWWGMTTGLSIIIALAVGMNFQRLRPPSAPPGDASRGG